MDQGRRDRVERSVRVAYRLLDVATVVLILSGQVNITGVFMTYEAGFSLSMAGPITGGARSEAYQTTPNGNLVIDLIDIIAAFLLILDQINVIGTFISAHRFSIVVSGPIFGELKRVATVPELAEFSAIYQDHVMQKCRNDRQQARK
ncbi:MAG: hypothetical protein ACXVP5_04280 [Tumebacillaceae bacterium]